jgi:hypothetical protein
MGLSTTWLDRKAGVVCFHSGLSTGFSYVQRFKMRDNWCVRIAIGFSSISFSISLVLLSLGNGETFAARYEFSLLWRQ